MSLSIKKMLSENMKESKFRQENTGFPKDLISK